MSETLTPNFPRRKNHVIFISHQNAAELIGALVPGAVPETLHAIITPAMREEGEWFRNWWTGRGGAWAPWELSTIDGASIASLLDKISASCGEDLAINITGGLKLMSLAAHDWARRRNIPCYYVDTGGDRLVYPGETWRQDPLPDLADIHSLLALGGYELGEAKTLAVPDERRKAILRILDIACDAASGREAVRALNGMACSGINAELPAKRAPALKKLLGICEACGKLKRGNFWIYFPDDEARRWCNGTWLEEYVQSCLGRLQKAGVVTSWACSAQVNHGNVKNELDAIFTARNRLFLVECKTGKLKNASNGYTNILYRMDSLGKRLGGSFAGTLVCSLDEVDNADERAKAAGAHSICGADLKNLEQHLLQWSKSNGRN